MENNPNQNNINGLPVNESFIFIDHKGNHKKGIEKRQRKLLAKLGFLTKFLLADEQIQIVTQALSPSTFFEQFLGGGFFLTQRYCLLVFTNMRIMHIPVDTKFNYKQSIAEIFYTDCKKIIRKRSSLVIEYKNGIKENFRSIRKQEQKRISLLLEKIDTSKDAISNGRKHLCPECTATLEKEIYHCPNCNLEFKTKSTAKKLALLFPGGGYFYTGYFWLGFCDFVGEVLIPVFAFGFLMQVLRGAYSAILSLVVFIMLFIMEKMISVFHSNTNIETFIPVKNGRKPNITRYGIVSLSIYAVLFLAIYLLQTNEIAYFENYNTALNSSLQKGDYDTAAEITLKAISRPATSQDDVIALYGVLINIYEECGQLNKAAQACWNNLQYMTSSNYENTEVKDTITAKKSLFENAIPTAITSFEACNNRYNNHFISNYYLGSIFLGNYGDQYIDYDRSAKHSLKAFTIDRTHLLSGLNLGIAYNCLKEHDKALNIFKELYSKAEDDAWICYYLGTTYTMLNQKDVGMPYIQKAVQLNPEIKNLIDSN